MNITDIKYGTEARSLMISGVSKLADAVSITLGPKGKNVAIHAHGKMPHLTKDGVTVANVINFKDPFENLGAQLVKEAAQRSAEVAGDGTTTSTVLASYILSEGSRVVDSDKDVRDFVSGIEEACNRVLKNLEKTKVEVNSKKDIANIATISANGDMHIGNLIADAIDKVGEDGAISVEQARGLETRLEIVDGTVIDRGFLSPYFITNPSKGLVELEKTCVLIYNQTLNTAKSILPALEYSASSNKSILIIANDVTSEALQTLVLNKMKGALNICAVKAPEFGSARTIALQDLASVLGAEVIVDDEGLTSGKVESCLGYSNKVVVDKNGCVFIGTSGKEDSILERINSARNIIESPSSSDVEKNVAKRRLTRLSKGVGVLRVGGSTEIEMLERKDRVDDALAAARAAKKSGTQPGGGVAIYKASKKCSKPSGSDSFCAGYNLLIKSCAEPLSMIARNAGCVPEIILEKIKQKGETGFNARTGKFGNMRDMDVIDPHLVVESSLKHAVSVACNILTVGCAVSIEENNESLNIIEDL